MLLLLALAALTGAGLAVLVAGLGPALPIPSGQAPLEERISAFGVQGRMAPEEEDERSFYERVLEPPVDRLRRFISSHTPEAAARDMEARLELAGRPYGLGVADLQVVRLVAAAAAFALGLLLGWVAGGAVVGVVVGLLLAVGGYLAPGIWLDRRASARRAAIVGSLPAVLDLLVVSVDAGLSFDSALGRVLEKLRNPLSEELTLVQREIALGRSRAEALEGLARRVQVEDITRFVNAMLQSDQLGVPVARTLRVQAGEARFLARQRVQQLAAQAPVKMVIPMIVFILPTVWLILLGPALLSVLLHGL